MERTKKRALSIMAVILAVFLLSMPGISSAEKPVAKVHPKKAISSGPMKGVKVKKKININEATLAELVRLPGIGEKTARNIVEFRKANGPFQKEDDLLKVKGIGEKKLAKIKSCITVK